MLRFLLLFVRLLRQQQPQLPHSSLWEWANTMNDQILAEHMKEDLAFQKEQREFNKSLATREDIAIMVREGTTEAIEAYFLSKGKTTFTIIVGTSILVGALVVIFGGFKTVLGWIGFNVIAK